MLSDLNLPQSNRGFTVIEEMRKAQSRCVNFILTAIPQMKAMGIEFVEMGPKDRAILEKWLADWKRTRD